MKELIRLLTKTTWIVTLILLFLTYGCQRENSTGKEAIDHAREEIDTAWLSEDADVIVAYSADDMTSCRRIWEGKQGRKKFTVSCRVFSSTSL